MASVAVSNTDWSPASEQSSLIRFGDLELDAATRTVHTAGRSSRLTVIEFAILQLLLSRAGCVVSREELVRVALQRSFSPFERSIDMHVSNLRKKLYTISDKTIIIETVRAVGYRLKVAG